MTNFFNPNADKYATNGYDLFRLNTLLASPGDIFESTQSGHAFAIGPESDIANVNVAYFDDQVANTFLQKTLITPDKSWSGRIDARNTDNYAPANRPGKILFWPNDVFQPDYLPKGFVGNQDFRVLTVPQLDVIEYFQPQGSLVPQRGDKTFAFPQLPIPINTCFVMVPYYGRKYASVRIFNATPALSLDWKIIGVRFGQNVLGDELQIANGTLATGIVAVATVKAGVNGMFDYLMIGITPTVALTQLTKTPITIIVSDTPSE